MPRRLAYIENRRVLADSGEITTDITVRDPITALIFEVRAQNGASNNRKNLLADCIDSVELIDGSEVLMSLDGYEALAIAAYELGYLPYQLIAEEGVLTQNWFVAIPFGRYLGDVAYSFDPTRFSNPQLRFKWNLANKNAVGATGFVTGSARFTVLADIMEGAEAPSYMLTKKQHYSFVTAASGIQYIDLPTNANHRSMYIRCHEDGVGAFGNLSNVKVSADQDKFIPFDMRRTDFIRWLTTKYPPMHYKHNVITYNGQTVYFVLKQDELAIFYPSTVDTTVTGVVNGIGEETVAVYVGSSGSGTPRSIMALVHGWLPFGVAYLPWGDKNTPNSWLDVSLFRSLRLELEQSNAGGNASVVVEQVRTY